MTSDEQALLELAEQNIYAAQTMLNANVNPGFIASRAYYAMFYCAQALLQRKGLSFSKHSAVIAAFGKEFAKTSLLSQDLHHHLRQAFDWRLDGDYNPGTTVTSDQAEESIRYAKSFLSETRKYLSTK